jgi:peptidoglycan/xylan/chitin deacetylase (PgdA/CDA1 family)
LTALARSLGDRLLRVPRVVKRAPGRPAAVALTFDDGPSAWTAQIAAALEAHDCRGTFFLLGEAVEREPEAVAALVRAGHEIGNHLWSHADPEHQSRAELRGEIERTAAAIGAAAGAAPPRLVRPPYCGAPREVARAAGREAGTLVVLRSVDPADWSTDRPEEIVERVLSQVGPGDIVCLHDGVAPRNTGTDTRAATAAAVAQLVPALLARDLRPVTVSELLA